jgi:flagellar protein FlaG
MFQSSLDALGKNQVSALNTMQGVKNTAGLAVVAKKEEPKPDPTEVNKQALTGAVQKLNEYVAPALQTIQFSIDQDSERIVVKVVDTATQKVLRQIPNEEVLAITKTLDKLQGLVINQEA